jgi:alpha-L-fucosidase
MRKKESMTTYKPTWDSLHQYRVPDWFRDAKFGIFIHWGIYSVPAMFDEWYPRRMYQKDSVIYEYHRETYGEDFGYKDFIPQFRAEAFDPVAWAELFRDAGARYIVPVAEHHDGFPMYATPLTRWNAANMGPERDVIGELGKAVRKAGLTFGLSSHRAEHWWFMNGGREFASDVQDPEFADFYGPATSCSQSRINGSQEWESNNWSPPPDQAYLNDWFARCCELVERFQPKLIYFDWWIHQQVFKPYLVKFAAYYYNHVPDGVINYKLDAFEKGTAVFDIERGYETQIQPAPWQTCTSVSKNSWGYISHHVYKEPAAIIHHLADIVSKNGCLLLNVGPKPDGTIPEEEQAILREIGQWLSVNGEAIYGTQPWRVFGEGPTQIPAGQFSDNDVSFTAQDIRFTSKGNRIFAITLGEPAATMEIKSIAGEKVISVKMPGIPNHLKWEQTETGLRIEIPKESTGRHAWVFEVTIGH